MQGRVLGLSCELTKSKGKSTDVLGHDVVLSLKEYYTVLGDWTVKVASFHQHRLFRADRRKKRGALTEDGEIVENGILLLLGKLEDLFEVDSLVELDAEGGCEMDARVGLLIKGAFILERDVGERRRGRGDDGKHGWRAASEKSEVAELVRG